MFYRVMANLLFKERDEALDFYHDCQVAIPKSDTINPDANTQETGIIQFHQCYHDEQPAKPCDLIAQETTEE